MTRQNTHNRSPRLLGLQGGGGRVPRTPVEIDLKEKRFASHIPARLLNLSVTGAFVETLPERENRIIDIEFSFPGQKGSFIITSRIQWCSRPTPLNPKLNRPVGMGVEFLRFVRGTPAELTGFLEKWNDLSGHGSLRHLHRVGSLEQPETVQADFSQAGENPHLDKVYGDCFYRLHSLEDRDIESALQQSLEDLMKGSSTPDAPYSGN